MAISTIQTSGGNYTSLAAWEAAVQGTLADVEQASCYDLADTTPVEISGSTTTASFYMSIYGQTSIGPSWRTDRYRLSISTWNAYVLRVTDDYVRLEDLQVEFTGSQATAAWAAVNIVGDNCLFDRAVIRGTSYSGAQDSKGLTFNSITTVATVRNVLIYDFTQGAGVGVDCGLQVGHDRVVLQNIGVHSSDTGFLDGASGLGHTLKNCWAQGCTDGFNLTANTASNNASDIVSDAPGTSAQTGSISFVDGASDNFQPAGGDGIAKDNGVDLTGSFTLDLTGATWAVPMDIGPMQAAAVSAVSHVGLLTLGVG